MQRISDISRRLSIFYVWSFLVFLVMESLILTILHGFSFCLVFKLHRFSL